jgi:hypothetical protein
MVYLEKGGWVKKLSSHANEEVACLGHQDNNPSWRIIEC